MCRVAKNLLAALSPKRGHARPGRHIERATVQGWFVQPDNRPTGQAIDRALPCTAGKPLVELACARRHGKSCRCDHWYGALHCFRGTPRVAPVENVSAAIRSGRNFHAPEPRVGTDKLIRFMPAHITSAQSFEPFNIGTATVQIKREQPIAERFGKLIPLIDHHAAMGMTATQIVGLAITAVLPAPLVSK